jgi:hypothetical protein
MWIFDGCFDKKIERSITSIGKTIDIFMKDNWENFTFSHDVLAFL